MSRKINLCPSVISRIKKNCEKNLESYGKLPKNTLKVRTTPFEQLNAELYEGYTLQKTGGIPMSGSILQAKSLGLAKKYGLENEFVGRFS